MTWLRTIVHEIVGLFVDDLSFAAAILIWLAVVYLVLPRIGLLPAWTGIVLFLGLAAILIESTLRYARRKNRR